MSLLTWNCRGLTNPTAIRVLADLIHNKRPRVVFLMETFLDKGRMENVRVQLGFENLFCVDANGHNDGLALLWSSWVDLQICSYSDNFIDTTLALDVGSPRWRFKGYYGFSQRQRWREAWQMLRRLAVQSAEPWVIMGDFNNLMHQSEKIGRAPHPPWCITSFTNAVADCGLQDFPFSDNQYTWVRSQGTPNMVEEKLDRILVSEDWLSLFEGATACSLACPYSDHLPLILTPVVTTTVWQRKRFLFDNMWLREDKCRAIVSHCWDRTTGLDVLTRIESCGRDIWRWGKNYNRDFQRKIERCKSRLDQLRSRRDEDGMREYGIVC
ncbi:PREDICTED: uncharacterized protein LOC109162272 [Ipomoea nil]|uniref:uncharacterized protein LOC109162272 n=1 Tax=Ipomoea nil TaxID=35883 RepID=UPI000901D4F1|nr:PREDICTED: uncharacterized protein LOC109162272 [Ipomoea nil]